MKRLFRHTTTLLRTALLLAAVLLTCRGAKAQTAEQRAAMPDAFETMDPAAIIGDGQYYYIQFYLGSDISYLSDRGNGNAARTKDYIPFAKDLQWTLVGTGTANQFKLKSLRGNWIYLDGKYKCTDNETTASTLTYYSHSGGGYDIGTTGDATKAMAGNDNSGPWVEVYNYDKGNARCRLRVAKLKDNVAHIIYWQEPIYKDGNVVDRNTNTRGGAPGFTTHHYLTYSGTGNVISDEVSSRRSVLWYYDAWQLPTAAAYHQDGLWTLESAGENGEFYIKKYGDEEYLNYDGNTNSVLGTKSADYGKYTLESPGANRYTRIQNSNRFVADDLTTSMFHWWDGWGANATTTTQAVPAMTYNVGNNHEVSTSDATVIGDDWHVRYQLYADLTGYSKIVFEGTPGLTLRVLMNRDEPNGTDEDGGPLLDWRVTIGDNGKGELSISELAFAHLNSIKVASGSGTISSIKLMKPNFVASTLTSSGWFDNWDGYGANANTTGSAQIAFNVGNTVNAGATIVGTDDVACLIYAKLTGSKKIVFEGTPGVQLRVLLNRQVDDSGPYVEKTATISNYGKAEVDISDLAYVHLNAIKAGWNSPSGTITAIRVMTPAIGGNSLFLSCANTDGNPVTQLAGNTSSDWYAGFLPVEVPVPNKDEFYQVVVGLRPSPPGLMVNYSGSASTYSEEPGTRVLWKLEQIDDYQHFRLKHPNNGTYLAGYNKVTQPNDPDGSLPTTNGNTEEYIKAEVYTINKFYDENQFVVKWFYVNPVDKEIPVDHMVTHRISYLKQYSDLHSDLDLDKQGLNTDAQSDWWNYERGTQKVNHFEITHYIKRGNTYTVEFPTVLNKSNDHRFFQRFYNYDEDKVGDVMDLDNLKAHVSLDNLDDGDVQYFLYRNGMVTGQKLDWTSVENGGMRRDALRRFNFTNSDGKPITVAVDVSRYDDKTYQNASSPLDGDLEEPSLTMRYIYYMKDAKEMATKLAAKTFKGDNFVDSKEGENFLEAKTFHFPQRQIFYESQKKVGYRGEFIGLRHVFSDYWVFDGNGTGDDNLVSAVNNNQSGKIEVKIYDPNGTGIRLGGYNPNIDLKGTTEGSDADYQGFYFYDKMSDQNKTQYGDSRFVVFRYPAAGTDGIAKVPDNACGKPVYINVYLNNGGTRYQLAQFTVIFDPGTVTLPYKSVNGSDYVAKDGTTHVFGDRGPKRLIEKAGLPIAKVTFDYPANEKYHFPSDAVSIQGWERGAGSTIDDCGPIPMTFDKTNYSFSGFECNWGSYAIVSKMTTNYGNNILALPANDDEYGYGKVRDAADQLIKPALDADAGLQKGFLYIDASEQPGDICSAPFVGDFCAGDKLMFSGWISGSNKVGGSDNRCPGGITLTVKGEHNVHDADGRIVYDEHGEPKKETVTLYRFCPGQIYELDDGTGADGSTGASHVVWQQFYFEFTVTEKYDRHWIEVNNNCVSSQGGDFMLDNIAVYAIVPEVVAEVNTPLCVSVDESGNVVTDMRLLKLSVDYNKLLSSVEQIDNFSTSNTSEIGFMFLDKQVFLSNFREGLKALTPQEKQYLHLEAFDFSNITLEELSDAIEDGEFSEVHEVEVVQQGENGYAEYLAHYKAFEQAYAPAFDAAILGDKITWRSKNPTVNNVNPSVLYFEWNHDFNNLEPYSFEKAVNLTHPVYGEVVNGERKLVVNGNFPQLKWKTNTDYYIMTANVDITSGRPFVLFNLCSECTKSNVFRIEPPYTLLGLEKSEDSHDYVVCEGQIPTLVTDLKGYDLHGNEVAMKDINFDWWIGNSTTLATLDNYHRQQKDGLRLDEALTTLRIYYPDLTSLEGITGHPATGGNPALTQGMVAYLQELVDAGELVLHQKSVSIPAESASADDPYFYLVACPIHDGYFDKALNPSANEYVAYFCDEPQGLRVKVGEKAPTLKTGFVPDQNGFASYDYSAAGDAVLSIRLAKKAQFATVQHGSADDYGNNIHTPDNTNATDTHFLWLPIRNAFVQTTESEMVIQKTNDENIYLASTNDPVWDKLIYTAMNRYDATTHEHTGSLPVVGKIVQLNAIDVAKNVNSGKQEKDHNRLCVYFTNNFEVREGYSYTLSLPFKESPGENTCDGTILINLKIVPDYEVWTGGADNTDWNNDDNWRRADGNTVMPTTEPTDESKRNNNELLVSNTLPATSGLYQYETNYWNYRTPKDRILRKGFAPLYCTHILMKSNEWGDAPVLYDALNDKADLDAYPFPNLTEEYITSNIDFIDLKFETIEAIGSNSFAIFNETDCRLIYGTDNQNLGYNVFDKAVRTSNSGYYFKLGDKVVVDGKDCYLLRLQTPAGDDYSIWGSLGYLNSQPSTGTVSFVFGLKNQYGQDGANLALWELEPDGHGKFALKNVGTGGYLKNNSVAKYEKPTYFTFCTLKKEESTTSHTKFNILKYDMQARLYDIWADTYGSAPDRGRPGDLIAEMYQINSCDEIVFQPSAELLNAHLLNYNNAWVEYQLDNNRWYLLGSPLQGTISGEWYAPTGTAQQKTTYYENVTFGEGYDRYSPAIYQRSWDKAKAVLYEIGADYATADDDQTQNLGSSLQGAWATNGWNDTGADRYLDRLGYKPMGGKKANVAMKGIWSNTYNDAAVDYTQGGFSVMVKNDLKGGSNANPAIIRLPKEDTMYDYYEFSQTGANDGGTDTELSTVQSSKNRAKNRGRLKSDLLLPKVDATNVSNTYQQIQRTETTASRYGDMRTYTRVPTQPNADYGLPIANKLNAISETVSPGISNLGYYLVENPFVAGLDMTKFFEVNTGLEKKYWILTASGQQLVQLADAGTWIKQENGTFTITDAKVAPGQGFFVQATTPGEATTISFTADMQAKTRYGVKSGEETFTIVVGTKQRMTTKEETITLEDGTTKTVTVEVPEVDDSGNYVVKDITDNVTISTYAQATGDGNQFPLKSRATRSAGKEPLGMVITAQRGSLGSSALVMLRSEASNDFMPEEDTEVFLNSDLKQVPTVYTLCGRLATTVNSIREFRTLPLGVESASDAPCLLTFRDVETLGDSVALYDAVEKKLTPLESGMTVSVSGQTQNRYYLVRSLNMEEAAEETHLQIFTEGMTARVIASTQEPVVSVRCYDMAGRLLHAASPQKPEYSFTLPRTGVYIIEAGTDNDRKTRKVMVND